MADSTQVPYRRRYRSLQTAICLAAITGLAGCAAVKSTRATNANTKLEAGQKAKAVDGLLYFLPMRDIEVTVTVPAADSKDVVVSAKETAAMPDFSQAFVASVPRSWIATSKASLHVNARGLLDSESTSSVTSSLTAVLQSAAGLAAGLRTTGKAPQPEKQDCSPGTYSKIIQLTVGAEGNVVVPPKPTEVCGFNFEVIAPAITQPTRTVVPEDGKSRAGAFYRVSLPYRVKVTPKMRTEPVREFLVFSPTGSNTYFLPATRAAFASNDTSFAFDNGVPTQYGQTVQSELVGFVGLPATLAQSYFKAIGDLFTSRTGNLASEQKYLEARSALAIAQQQREACEQAVRADDRARIAADCG